jgi:NhaP-type Na+/H+ or K+/H+ antiporter
VLRTGNKIAIIKKGEEKMTRSKVIWRNVFVLAVAGGLAFWVTNFAISRTPIAAEYRAALSISYYPMLLEALLGGLMIGFCVSYFLLRFFDKIPTKDPIIKSVILTFIVLIIVTISIGGPSSFLATSDVLRYFLIGTIFNVLRILALGIGIGYLYRRLYKGFDPSANASKSAQAE